VKINLGPKVEASDGTASRIDALLAEGRREHSSLGLPS
jgi:hypothetical protein